MEPPGCTLNMAMEAAGSSPNPAASSALACPAMAAAPSVGTSVPLRVR